MKRTVRLHTSSPQIAEVPLYAIRKAFEGKAFLVHSPFRGVISIYRKHFVHVQLSKCETEV